MTTNQVAVAIVTGAGGGIGKGIAQRLSEDGYVVVCIDIDGKAVEAASKEISKSVWFKLDITKESEVIQLRTKLEELKLQPTLLVNTAGIFFLHDIVTMEENDFDAIMNVNLKGIFFMCKTFIPSFLKVGKGNIINIASTAGLRGGKNRAVYSASKGAVVLFTRSLAADYGHLGIRANCVCPGLIDTPMASWIRENPPEFDKFEKSIPAQRVGTVEDVANSVSFLASDQSSYIHGESLVVDGGGLA